MTSGMAQSKDDLYEVDPICFECPYPECLYPSCRIKNKKRSKQQYRRNENNLAAIKMVRKGMSIYECSKKLCINRSGLLRSLKGPVWKDWYEQALEEGRAARRKRPNR